MISPAFYKVHKAIKENKYIHYFLKGGRGSTKSSFAAVEMLLAIMKNKDMNGVCVRRYGKSLRESVFNQLLWAMEVLEVSHLWESKVSVPELIYLPTNQKIIFRGADDVSKIKSVKFVNGYCGFVWYEECDEFKCYEDIVSINQSLLRGGSKYSVLYTYNPPKSANHWINELCREERCDKLVHHSTYLTTPEKWLGEQFFTEAEHLKKTMPELYLNQYMGESVKKEGLILKNYTVEEKEFKGDVFFMGQDFGFNHANVILLLGFYENEIYILKELYVKGLETNEIINLAEDIFEKNVIMWCDSAEPDRIKAWQKAGFRAVGVSKEKNSITAQIDYLMGKKIIINPSCKNTIREIENWCWMKDKNSGEYIDIPTPVNDDAMAALRYGIEYVRKI